MEKIKLGNCATYINGYAFKPTDWKKSGIPIIRIQDLTKSNSNPNYYDGKLDEKYIVKNGDVLISWSGSLGVYEWNGDIAYLNQHIFKVIFDKKEINKNYFIYLVESKIHEMLKNVHGSTMKHITKSNFDNIDINLHTINEQEEIANKITAVKDVINIRKEQLENLEQLVKSQFVEMFGDIENTKYDVYKLSELTNLITDGEHKKPNYTEKGTPFISVVNITTGELKFEDCKFVSDEDACKFNKRCNPEKDDILYTKVGATYGRSAIVDTDKKFALYVSVCLIKPKKDLINPIFLNYTMRQPYVKSQADKCIKGIGVPDLHLIEIKNFKIILPPIEEQNQFAEFVKLIDKQKFVIVEIIMIYDIILRNILNNIMG